MRYPFPYKRDPPIPAPTQHKRQGNLSLLKHVLGNKTPILVSQNVTPVCNLEAGERAE